MLSQLLARCAGPRDGRLFILWAGTLDESSEPAARILSNSRSALLGLLDSRGRLKPPIGALFRAYCLLIEWSVLLSLRGVKFARTHPLPGCFPPSFCWPSTDERVLRIGTVVVAAGCVTCTRKVFFVYPPSISQNCQRGLMDAGSNRVCSASGTRLSNAKTLRPSSIHGYVQTCCSQQRSRYLSSPNSHSLSCGFQYHSRSIRSPMLLL
jgi:hypothetical protein